MDGKSYVGLDYTQPDTIYFSNIVSASSSIKKAFLFFIRYHYPAGASIYKDTPINIRFNNSTISIDSSNIVAHGFFCGLINTPITSEVDYIVKDVTSLALTSGNVLFTPDQVALMIADTSRKLVYNQPCLIILYEDVNLPPINASFLLNTNYNYNPNTYSLNNLNTIINTTDVGLSLWTSNTRNELNFQIDAGAGAFNLGDIFQCNPMFNCSTSSQGSFFYNNSSLFPLDDDNQDAIFDSTDAIANIQSYLPSNINAFNLISSTSGTYRCSNNTLGFFLAYTTPCPASVSKDTSITICKGQNVQLSASTGFTNCNWYPLAGLTDSTIATPIASPQHSTNYIAYVKDAAGCMHTEHTQIIVHGAPEPDTIVTTNAVCGSQLGTLSITPNYHNYGYNYNIGNGTTTDTSITNILPGTYTLTTIDDAGCTFQSNFTITEVNPVTANFSTQTATSSFIAPLYVNFNNNTTGATNYTWYFPTTTTNTCNTNYTFTEAGTYTVTLIAYNNLQQCSDTATKVIIVLPQDTAGIFILNVFSPNGDGVNDMFEVRIKNAELELFEIYDRWGVVIIKNEELKINSNGLISWSGRTTSGIECSAGTYFYVIKIKVDEKYSKEGIKEYKGFITLVR